MGVSDQWLSMSLAGVGRAGKLRAPGYDVESARGSRVSISYPGIQEWYAAGPLGIEQGFTVIRHPRGRRGPLVLVLRLRGSLRAALAGSEVDFLTSAARVSERYGGLVAFDAQGRRLAATFALAGRRLLIRVIDRGAAYPLTIDPFIEQQKIVPSDENVQRLSSTFGMGVALSSDVSTAVIGDTSDDDQEGAVWVYTRSGSVWTEQQKIVPTDETGKAQFGWGVALSSDGSTALIGGFDDSGNTGAAWVYTRSGSVWTEQQKIVPTDETSSDPQFGWSVALSSDGNTALIGGERDLAVRVYTRSGSVWTEQQNIAPTHQGGGPFGQSVALSSDGSTALIGGNVLAGTGGAAWVYTLSDAAWTEQTKIVPTDEQAGSDAHFGWSVALSSSGSTALISGPYDGIPITGAAWIYERSGRAWTEQQKIIPTDENNGYFAFGPSVALSSDAGTALIGGDTDQAWVYTVGPGAAPVNKVPPRITRRSRRGGTLTCSTGSWTGSPTKYTYAWDRNGTLLADFTGSTYRLGTLDEGTTFTCVVTATNAAGSASATSNAVKIPIPKVPHCSAATGSMTGTTIGQVTLGMTQSRARYLYRQHSNHGKQYEDFFCLTPIGVRVGYASPILLKNLPKQTQLTLRGRVVWASTSDPYYSLDGVRAGESIATAAQVLGAEPPFHIGLNYWYLARKAGYTAVLKVRGTAVQELGIADNSLTATRKTQNVLMHSFY
ncbi:MAG: FG-GAP repeat protein [Solirubrobacteraceae bacterium]